MSYLFVWLFIYLFTYLHIRIFFCHFSRALAGLDPETTLVVVVSKTFTTAETMLNARTVKKWLLDSEVFSGVDKDVVLRQHVVAVSTAG